MKVEEKPNVMKDGMVTLVISSRLCQCVPIYTSDVTVRSFTSLAEQACSHGQTMQTVC